MTGALTTSGCVGPGSHVGRASHVGLALFALAVGGFAIGTAEFVTMGLLPQITTGVDISIPTAGHVVSAYALGVVVGAPLITTLGARVSRKSMLLWLMVAFAVVPMSSASQTCNRPSALSSARIEVLPSDGCGGTQRWVARTVNVATTPTIA